MLDLNFVRDNLPRVEEMLRQRGVDAAAVLKDFHAVDTQRRHAITEAETMKAQKPWIEESREFFGLLILIGVLVINLIVAKRRKRAK